MVETIGIFADKPQACTGMAVVCHNIARQLIKKSKLRVIYFGRFGYEKGAFAPEAETQLYKGYEYVPCEGGVWKAETVENLIKLYKVTAVFSEDDWFSASGLVKATQMTKVPLHFLTPIDSLPIHPDSFKIFSLCKKVYVPNSSYKKIPNGVYLKHGVNGIMFQPLTSQQKRLFDRFTFLWIGRNEERKAMGRAIIAYKNVASKTNIPSQMIIRSDWTTEKGVNTALYLSRHKEIPIVRDQMRDIEQEYLQQIYANCDALIITSKAGGFELQSIEAQACGLPVLVTDWTFMNETIVDGKSGFLIPVSDYCDDIPKLGRMWGNISIDALSEKMLWCLQNQKDVKQMGQWARQHVLQEYNWDTIGEILYREMGYE